MEKVLSLIELSNTYIVAAQCVAIAILLVWNICLGAKLRRLRLKKNAKIADGGIAEIINAINSHDESYAYIKSRLTELEHRQDVQDMCLGGCFQRIGVVRFNAFADVAGEQSVAVAILDAKNNGIVLNIVNSRQGSSVYAKSIVDGVAERTLSDEETKALNKAMS